MSVARRLVIFISYCAATSPDAAFADVIAKQFGPWHVECQASEARMPPRFVECAMEQAVASQSNSKRHLSVLLTFEFGRNPSIDASAIRERSTGAQLAASWSPPQLRIVAPAGTQFPNGVVLFRDGVQDSWIPFGSYDARGAFADLSPTDDNLAEWSTSKEVLVQLADKPDAGYALPVALTGLTAHWSAAMEWAREVYNLPAVVARARPQPPRRPESVAQFELATCNGRYYRVVEVQRSGNSNQVTPDSVRIMRTLLDSRQTQACPGPVEIKYRPEPNVTASFMPAAAVIERQLVSLGLAADDIQLTAPKSSSGRY